MTGKVITHEEAKETHARLFDSYIYGDFIPFPTRSDLDTIKQYITQQEQFAKDVANYFHVIEVFDKYKREHPDKTDDEIKEVLKDEVALYRELFSKLTKGVAK